MKIAIIGAGITGIELALKFHKEGANITIFEKEAVGANLLNFSSKRFNLPYSDLISFSARETLQSELPHLLEKINFEEKPTYGEFVTNYLEPMAKYLAIFHNITHTEVLRVQKRYLLKDEIPTGKSRMSDLFRVIYTIDPKSSVTSQIKENPEVFNNMDTKFIESLSESMEGFEDFDIVIDSTSRSVPERLGNGSFCIGEKALQGMSGLYYGFDAVKNSSEYDSVKELAVVGSGEVAAHAVIAFFNEYKTNSRLFLITTEERPFEQLEKENPQLFFELEEALAKESTHFQSEVEKFSKKYKEWNELEDYIKAKMPKPVEPIPNYVVFSGHNLSSIDRLIDKDKFYLTCEKPEFRNSLVQKENGVIPLKTISTNAVVVATGFKKNEQIFEALNLNNYDTINKSEPGFYSPEIHSVETKALESMSEIIFSDVLNFFSRG